MNKQATYKTQMPIGSEIEKNKPFYMVIRLGSDGYQQADASPTMRYESINDAAIEAQRLAAKHPTHPRGFAVVQAIAVYKASVNIDMVSLGKKTTTKK